MDNCHSGEKMRQNTRWLGACYMEPFPTPKASNATPFPAFFVTYLKKGNMVSWLWIIRVKKGDLILIFQESWPPEPFTEIWKLTKAAWLQPAPYHRKQQQLLKRLKQIMLRQAGTQMGRHCPPRANKRCVCWLIQQKTHGKFPLHHWIWLIDATLHESWACHKFSMEIPDVL